VNELGLKQPPNRLARSTEEAVAAAAEIGFPLVVRPSYVLGGRAMEIVYNETDLKYYMKNAVSVSNDAPVLLDRFLDDAVEVDVDAICDGEEVLIGSIMEHIEQAGVHSGDSACSLPPYSLSTEVQQQLREQTRQLALKLGVVGLMNIQFAIQFTDQLNGSGPNIYLLEVNPRASRTVPFVSKATGVPLAKIAARCMAGISLKQQGVTKEVVPENYAVKESVFPFVKFPGVDPLLGPEMKSTGEVMGVGKTFGMAFAKAQLGAGVVLPTRGRVFISVRERDRGHAVSLGRELVNKGFDLVATSGTGSALQAAGIAFRQVNKVYEGRPHIVDMIKNGDIALIINTTEGKKTIQDSYTLRAAALQHKVSYTTTIAGANATIRALDYLEVNDVIRLQDLHEKIHKNIQQEEAIA
jgi:carbamoyl-phosphate synthase large subunit